MQWVKTKQDGARSQSKAGQCAQNAPTDALFNCTGWERSISLLILVLRTISNIKRHHIQFEFQIMSATGQIDADGQVWCKN